jgi:hypothetical protein
VPRGYPSRPYPGAIVAGHFVVFDNANSAEIRLFANGGGKLTFLSTGNCMAAVEITVR